MALVHPTLVILLEAYKDYRGKKGICPGNEEDMNMFPNKRGKPIFEANAYSLPEAAQFSPFSFKKGLFLPPSWSFWIL